MLLESSPESNEQDHHSVPNRHCDVSRRSCSASIGGLGGLADEPVGGHYTVTDRSELSESRTEIVSAINLRNRNTEQVADRLSRDNHQEVRERSSINSPQFNADKPHYVN